MRTKLFHSFAALLLGITACSTTNQSDLSGMSFSDEPLVGKFVWYDLITEDVAAAREFYGGLFDWTFEKIAQRDGSDYFAARSGDLYVAGLLAVDPTSEKVSRWLPYISVTDVDMAVDRSVGAGASVAATARNVNLGRVAAIVDPEGAVIGLARSNIGDPDDRTTRAAPDRVVWSELLSGDPAQAAEFYSVLAGFDVETVSRRGGEYTFLTVNGVQRAGILERPNEDIEPVWLTYFGVEDPRAAAERAASLGGTIILPASPEVREGTMAVVTDPSGAVLVLQKTPL